jgi:integrase
MDNSERHRRRYEAGLLRIQKLGKSRKILPENAKLIREFVTYLQATSIKPATIWKYVYCYEKLLNAFDRNVVIINATRDDVIKAMTRIEAINTINPETKAKIKICLKRMFKHFAGEDLYYPKQIAWIKTSTNLESKLTPSDLLTEEEIDRIISNAHNIRDKAILGMMAEAPLRPHEILMMKRKHISVETNPAYIIVPEGTKTGRRRIALYESVQLLAAYLNTYKDLRPDDALFMHETWNKEKKPMTYDALRIMIEKTGKRAGINKKVYPYLFRHSAITRLSSKVSNAVLERAAGWKHGTNMHRVYEHLSESEVDRELAKAHGTEIPAAEIQKPRFKICPRCKLSNPMDFIYCSRCGSTIDIGTRAREAELKKVTEEAAGEMYNRQAEIGKRTKQGILKTRKERKRPTRSSGD